MSSLLDKLFYYSPDYVFTDAMFDEMWNHDKNRFIAILFYLRRHRREPLTKYISGRGERKIFYQAIIWMSHHKIESLQTIIPYIPDCGYWKDLLVLMGTPAEATVVSLFATQLHRDYSSYTSPIPGLVSLASKWTPNEGSSSDKAHGTFGKIARAMQLTRKALRTLVLVPLRKYIGVTEQAITEKKWESIRYPLVPKLCLNMNAATFAKHDPDRFENYNNSVTQTKHQALPVLTESILYNKGNPVITTANNKSMIIGVDISGSMAGLPLALGASLCYESGVDYWIPFDFEHGRTQDMLELRKITGTSVMERVDEILSATGTGYSLDDCLHISTTMNKNHIVIITNMAMDESEFPMVPHEAHVTYWCINQKIPSIISRNNITVIEGYDINIYTELCKGVIVTSDLYKNIILQTLQHAHVVPVI